ncbi:unnamed protein product [Closterium sp. NIES-54]
MRAFCHAECIHQTFMLPASPEQNGNAERRIGMVMDVARTSMIHAAAPHFLWPFAVQYAAHQIILQPPFVRDTSADKLSSRAAPCVFLGFPHDASRWQFYHPTSCRVLSSQDVTFDESVFYYHLFPYRTALLPPPPLFLAPGTPPVDPLPPQSPAPSGVLSLRVRGVGVLSQRLLSKKVRSLGVPSLCVWSLATVVTDPSFESTLASALVAELVDFADACRLDCAVSLAAESESASVCPPSVGDSHGHRDSFLEFHRHLRRRGSPAWVERRLWYVDSPPVFKARYVARGFNQQQGVDFFQTFSPTPKMTTLRVLLHVAAQGDYELHSLDFSTAFLQGSLHEEIWLRRPPGFTGSFPAGTQWSLWRQVYGLCQAPCEWHDTLRTTLAALGFAPSTVDPSLFRRTDNALPPYYVLVYVGDLVFGTTNIEALAHMKSELQKRHTCTDLGELTSYLGLRITRDRAQHTITLTQSHMVQQVLQPFGFTYSSPYSTPLPTGHSLSAPPSDESVEPSGSYPELMGCLMYLMTCTRPDLAYPLSILACYVAPRSHRPQHLDAAKRVLRYLCSTLGMGLVLGGRGPVVLTGHADASWVDDLATQRSSQGYTFSLGSSSVSWRSTRSSFVLSSSCEAEIYAGAMAAQELC